MSSKHENGVPECPSCTEKLLQAHSEIAEIFRAIIKPKFPDCHISWTFRGEADQNEAVAMNKSKLKFPLSAHNKSDDRGNPCALAMDLFQLCSNSMAAWPWIYFKDIADFLKLKHPDVIWGGDFKSIGDSDHFEIKIKS